MGEFYHSVLYGVVLNCDLQECSTVFYIGTWFKLFTGEFARFLYENHIRTCKVRRVINSR